jgi:hypothetical protein
MFLSKVESGEKKNQAIWTCALYEAVFLQQCDWILSQSLPNHDDFTC